MSQQKEKTQRKTKQEDDYYKVDPKRDKKRKNDYTVNRQHKRNWED